MKMMTNRKRDRIILNLNKNANNKYDIRYLYGNFKHEIYMK